MCACVHVWIKVWWTVCVMLTNVPRLSGIGLVYHRVVFAIDRIWQPETIEKLKEFLSEHCNLHAIAMICRKYIQQNVPICASLVDD